MSWCRASQPIRNPPVTSFSRCLKCKTPTPICSCNRPNLACKRFLGYLRKFTFTNKLLLATSALQKTVYGTVLVTFY